MVITAFNPETIELEKTYLTQAYSAGVTGITVKNNNRFSNTNRIMIGEQGREKTEVVSVNAAVTPGTSLTITTTTYSHESDDPVYVLRYDQVKFYRSTTGVNGSYSLLTTVDLDVDNSDLTTKYDDTTGVASYYYKTSYYNSVSTLESSLSDPVAGSGYVRNTVGFLLDELFEEFKDPNEQIATRNQVLGWMNEVNDDLQTKVKRPFNFLHTRTNLTLTAATETIAFPTNSNGTQTIWKIDQINHYYNSTSDTTTEEMRPIRILPLEEFRYRFRDQLNTTNNDELQYIAIDTAVNKFRVYPKPLTTQAGALYVYYWKYFTELDSEADVFETPNQRIYKLYCLGKYYRAKAMSDNAYAQLSNFYFADYANEVSKLIKTDMKDQGSPHSFKFLPQRVSGLRRV